LVIGCSGLRSTVDGVRLVVVVLRRGGRKTLSAGAHPGVFVLGWALVGGSDGRLDLAAVP
jgi:hypothetical protein